MKRKIKNTENDKRNRNRKPVQWYDKYPYLHDRGAGWWDLGRWVVRLLEKLDF